MSYHLKHPFQWRKPMKRTPMRSGYLASVVLLAGLLFGITIGSVGAQDALLTGTLSKNGEHYSVDGIEVGIGPAWYIEVVDADADYDGDGTIKTIAAELDGLVGTAVTLEGEAGRCGDFDVFVINEQTYRSPGRPAWAGGPTVVGAIHPGIDTVDDADDGTGRPLWAGTGQGKPCSSSPALAP
jgi:hypothetical protein